MRDVNRIPAVLEAVKYLWTREPDMRLGQLLWALAGKDPFYIEEGELLLEIEKRHQLLDGQQK